MNKRMKGTIASALAGAATLAALLVVSQASAGSPTRASWAAAANQKCAAANARIRALPKATTLPVLIRDTRSTLGVSKQLTNQLSLIPVPRRERMSVHTLLTNSRAQNSIVEERLLPALRTGAQSRVHQVTAELKPLGTRFNKLARSLGAVVCAENPAPHGP